MSSSPSPKKGKKPKTLEHLHQSLFGGMDAAFLPDEMKERFMAGIVQKQVASGCKIFLDESPRAAKLCSLVNATKSLIPTKLQDSLVNDMVGVYLDQKRSEKQIHGKSARSQTTMAAPPPVQLKPPPTNSPFK
jgi:hypothetical protein